MICELLPSLFLFKIAKAWVALEGLESILSFIGQELKRILDINDNIDEEFTIFSFTVQTCCRICRWLKVVTMVMNMMESSSLNLYGDFFSRSKQLICFSYMVCLNNYFQSLLFLFFFFLFWFQNLIDLAGSESSKTETTGLRRKEGSYINKSLLTLGTVCKQKDLILLLWWNFLLLIFLYWSQMTLFLK